jgi:hypothetical protein
VKLSDKRAYVSNYFLCKQYRVIRRIYKASDHHPIVNMSKIEAYKESLRSVKNLDEYLLEESGLPGPRGNIELAQAIADVGDEKLFRRLIGFTAEKAPVNSPYEFLAFCGTVGMGRSLAEGHREALEILRAQASDPRWRVREGVAMGLQRYGMADMSGLFRAKSFRRS